MKKRTLLSFLISMGAIVYIYFFINFVIHNFWWIIPIGIYLLYFLTVNINEKKRLDDEALYVKNCKEIRIDFW